MHFIKNRSEKMEALKQSAYASVKNIGYFDATCLANMCAGYYDFLMLECNNTLMNKTSLNPDEMEEEVSALLMSNDFYLKTSERFLSSVYKYKRILNVGRDYILDEDVKSSPINESLDESLKFIETLASMMMVDFITVESKEYREFEDRIMALDFILSMVDN